MILLSISPVSVRYTSRGLGANGKGLRETEENGSESLRAVFLERLVVELWRGERHKIYALIYANSCFQLKDSQPRTSAVFGSEGRASCFRTKGSQIAIIQAGKEYKAASNERVMGREGNRARDSTILRQYNGEQEAPLIRGP